MMITTRVLALLLITTLAACGDDDGGSNPDSGAGSGGSSGSGGTSGSGGSAGDMDSGAGTGATGGSAGDEDAGEIGTLIGPTGGVVQAENVVMTIPAGALTEDRLFAITASNTPPIVLPTFLTALSAYFTITPHGTQFMSPVTIALPTNVGPTDDVSVWFLDDEDDTTWEQLGMAELQGAFGVFTTSHLTIFGLAERRSGSVICIPMCGLNECGPDQCGGACGTCDSGETCDRGFCETSGTGGTGGTGGAGGQGGQGGQGGTGSTTQEICNNGVSDDADPLIDCADTDCSAQCGDLNLDWSVTLNGNAATCGAVGGDTVAILATAEGSGLTYSATIACSVGMHTLVVPAGTYDIALALQEPGPTALTGANIANAIVPAQGNSNPEAVVFDVQTTSCAQVVISRIYNAGGFDSAGYNHDFVELHNRSQFTIDVGTWSIQTRNNNGTGAPWVVTPLGDPTPGTTLLPAQGYWLVELGRSSFEQNVGSAVPSPDTIGASDTNLSGYSFDVVLRDVTSSVQADVCPGSAIDAFGNLCGEGNSLGMFSQTSTTMLQRAEDCSDLDNNSADFSAVTLSAPRNASSTASTCTACN